MTPAQLAQPRRTQVPQTRNNKRFTIYDMMEARGEFDSNPANVNSRDAQGLPIYKKQLFPKMLYHPQGEERITRPADAISTPFGPKLVGEQRELISRIVGSEEELAEWLEKGWHETPRQALRAAAKAEGKTLVEEVTPQERALDAKADEIATLKAQLAELTAKNTELELGLKPQAAAAGTAKK